MKKWFILLLTFGNVAFAQGIPENEEEIQNYDLRTSLQNLVTNIESEDFKKTVDATIQSFTVEFRSNPTYKPGAPSNRSRRVRSLISISEDRKELAVSFEQYQEAPQRALRDLVSFMLTTRLGRALTNAETLEILNAIAKPLELE